MKTYLHRLIPTVIFFALCSLVAPRAHAIPVEGEVVPDARVEDVDGRTVESKFWRGKATVLFYEGRDSSEQNQAIKDDLTKLVKTETYRSTLRVAAIADVSDFNLWPIKGIVKDKVREQSVARGMSIYCDWDGTFRSKFKLNRGVSNVILIGKDGRVRLAFSGTGKRTDRALLLDRLRAEVGGP